MCLASEDICRQIVPLVTHHCVIQKLFFVKTSCYIFSLHDKNQEGWGQKFNRSLELFINRRSALERILDIQVECLQMKFISERQREEKFSHYLSLLFQCTCLLLQEQPLSCASPTTYPDRWLVPYVNLIRILLGSQVSTEKVSLPYVRLCSLNCYFGSFNFILKKCVVVSAEAQEYNSLCTPVSEIHVQYMCTDVSSHKYRRAFHTQLLL